MAKKPNLVAHFADIHELVRIERRILTAFFLKHNDFFMEKGISLPEIGDEEPELDLTACSKSLLSFCVTTANGNGDTPTPAQRLANALDCVALIVSNSHYKCIDNMLTRIETERLSDPINEERKRIGIGDKTPSMWGRVLLIWLCDKDGEELDYVHNFLKSWGTRGLKEYPEKWGYVPPEGELIPDDKRPERTAKIDEAMLGKIEEKLNAYFTSTYHTTCRIEDYEEFPDGQHWFFVVYGGRPTSIELYEQDDESSPFLTKRENVVPAKRDIVIHDNASKLLRIKANTAKQEELYRAAFGGLLYGDEEAFLTSEVYCLRPLETDDISKLLDPPDSLEHVIENVRITKLLFQTDYSDDDAKITFQLKTTRSLARYWSRNRQKSDKLLGADFSFKFVGRNGRTTVKVSASNGLGMKPDTHEFYIRDFFIQKGFARRVQLKPLVPNTDVSGFSLNRILETLGSLVRDGNLSKCNFRNSCSDEEWQFIKAYLTPQSGEQFVSSYTPPGSSCTYNVTNLRGEYILHSDDERAEWSKRRVSYHDIRLYKLDEDKFTKAVQNALFETGNKRKVGDGCYRLGSDSETSTTWFLLFPREDKGNPLQYISAMGKYVEPSESVVLLELPGHELSTDTYAQQCTQYSLDSVLSVNGENELVSNEDLRNHLEERNGGKSDDAAKWPLAMPKDRSWGRVSIKILPSGNNTPKVWIQYGNAQKTFSATEIPFLRMGGEDITNSNFKLLNKLVWLHQQGETFTIRRNNSIDGLPAARLECEVSHSSLDKLAKSMSHYFSINDVFYGETKDKELTLRLASAKSDVPYSD